MLETWKEVICSRCNSLSGHGKCLAIIISPSPRRIHFSFLSSQCHLVPLAELQCCSMWPMLVKTVSVFPPLLCRAHRFFHPSCGWLLIIKGFLIRFSLSSFPLHTVCETQFRSPVYPRAVSTSPSFSHQIAACNIDIYLMRLLWRWNTLAHVK